jgi:hypothetical protein
VPRFVIDYARLAAEMGKVLDVKARRLAVGAVQKVLSARDLQSVFPGCVGVGTPFIVRDPDTYQPYMLFTAWSDPSGLAKQIWVAPIDEDLVVDVSRAKKIADGSLFNVTGLLTVHAYWDDYNEQWVLFTTFYDGPAPNVAGVIFVDKDFNVRDKQMLTFTKADGSFVNLGDAGISPVPLHDRTVLLLAGTDKNLFLLPGGNKRPLPSPKHINYVATEVADRPFRITPLYFGDKFDVHQLLLLDQGLVMLTDSHNRGHWFIQVLYGAEKDWVKVNIGITWVPFVFVAPILPPLTIYFTGVVGNMNHPHYTNLLKEPYLFFARAPTRYWGGKRRYAYDIWVARIDPDCVFSPRGKVLVASGTNEPNAIPDVMPIPTFGARRITIYLFGVSAAGTLTLTESSSPYHIYAQTGVRYRTTYSVNAGANKIVVDSPAPWIALGLNVSLAEWMVVIDCT